MGIRILVGILGVIIIGALVSGDVSANETDSWVTSQIVQVLHTEVELPTTTESSCVGTFTRIQFEQEGILRTACVFGSSGKVRLARYTNLVGQYEYAVAFTTNATFYPLRDFCIGAERCVYSQAKDTVYLQEMEGLTSFGYSALSNFSDRLARADGERVAYTVDMDAKVPIIQGLTVRSLAMSSNGDWLVAEILGKGVVRHEVASGEYTWVSSTAVGTGPSPQPVLGMGISDDGRWVSVTGWRQGLQVYEVANECAESNGAFEEVTTWCAGSSLDKYQLFPGYVRAYKPQFSAGGTRISLLLITQTSVKRVTVAWAGQSEMEPPQYVALGDSYSSGEGELFDSFYIPSTNTETNHCHVSTRSYPYLLGASWGVEAKSAACSGARIPDARSVQLASLSEGVSLASLGIGGNDVDIIGKLKTCLGPGTCEWARAGFRAAGVAEMRRIVPDLLQLISDMKTSTAANVFVVGYPSVIYTGGDAKCSAVVGALLDQDERLYLEESIKYLNTILRAAARYASVAYVDIERALDGERLCEGREEAMNGVRFGDDIAPISFLGGVKFIGAESFHPTPKGHARIAEMIEAQLGAVWAPVRCNSCEVDVAPNSYWTVATTPAQLQLLQMSQQMLSSGIVRSGEKYPLSIDPRTLLPDSPVTIEIRSDSQLLGQVRAGNDGSLVSEIAIPSDIDGYHSIHVIGKDLAGEPIDIYQVVYIEGATRAVVESEPRLAAGAPLVTVAGVDTTRTYPVESGLARLTQPLLMNGARYSGVKGVASLGDTPERLRWDGVLVMYLLFSFLLVILVAILLFRRKV